MSSGFSKISLYDGFAPPVPASISENTLPWTGLELVEVFERNESNFSILRTVEDADRIDDPTARLCKVGRHAAITASPLSIMLQ